MAETEASDQIISRIEKLLRLSESSNENEARLALERANELMLRYNLSVSQIKAHEKNGSIKYVKYEEIIESKKTDTEFKYIFSILQRHFFTRVVTGHNMYGEKVFWYLASETNLKIARYVDQFIYDAMTDGWVAYKRRAGANQGSRQSYYMGFYSGLDKQLSERRKKVEQEVGLMVVEDAGLVEFVQSHFNRLTTKGNRISINDSESFVAGHRDGNALQMRTGLEQNTGNGIRLLK